MPHVMSTTYHHGDLKAQLLTHAREHLELQGADALSLREMARTIGVTHAAAYRHFADKNALLHALAVAGFDALKAACIQATDAAANAPLERLKACGAAYVRFGRKNPNMLRHMFGVAGQPGPAAPVALASAEVFALLMQLVADGQKAGVIRDGDTRAVAQACWALVHGLASLLAQGLADTPKRKPAQTEAFVDAAIDRLFHGIAT